MTVVGYSTLEVIPSMKGLGRELEKQSSQFSSAGRKGGKQYGDAAGREAGTRFKTGLTGSLRGFVAPFAGILAGAGIADFFRDSFAEAKEAGQVSRVTAKLIETTGKAAGLTAVQVGDLAERMMEYAAVDDELIQSGANVMLTFKNVRNEVGEGNQIFDRSIKAGLDLAAVLGTDLSGSALQLGKALNDPIKGMTALGRAGVQFTAEQKEQIKGFVQAGDLLSAQKTILREVEQQVGGAAGAAADGTDRFAVAMGNLKEAFGQEIMPAVTAFSDWAVDDGIPALSEAGGAAKDAAAAFASLPAPILAGVGAFAVLKVAAATSIGTTVAAGVASVGSAFVGLRLRLMELTGAYASARSASITLTGPLAGVSLGASRAAAALAGLRAASVGAGTALKTGLGKSLAIVGGPWGAAMIAGTILVTKFWMEQQEAKQFVDDLTASIDAQTGALKDNGREQIAEQLRKSGAVKGAKELGIALEDIQKAAEGDVAALSRVHGVIDEIRSGRGLSGMDAPFGLSRVFRDDDVNAANDIRDALSDVGASLDEARGRASETAEMLGKSAGATGDAGRAFVSYKTQIDLARTAMQKLIQVEQKRVQNAIQQGRDEIALLSTMKATRDEALKGARTLDINTEAGRENKAALLDLADQWANSTPKAQAALGGYEAMRKKFVELATAMGGGGDSARNQAIRLADALLKVPKTAPLKFQSEGFQARMREIQILKEEAAKLRAAFRIVYSSQAAAQQGALADRRFATGGFIGGRGTGTSDSNLIWASKGEFMQRKAAVDYYGVEFMRRLNNLQIPRFAQGGPIAAPAPRAVAASGGVHVHIGQVVAHDYGDFMSQMTKRVQKAQSDGVRMGGR